MSSKRSYQQIQQHQQQQEEPWLHYPTSFNAKDFSRSATASAVQSSARQKHLSLGSIEHFRQSQLHQDAFQMRSTASSPTPQQQPQQQQPSQRTEPSSITFIPEIKHRRSLARLSTPSASLHYGVASDAYGYSSYRSSRSRRGGPPPKPLSEELSMALQNNDDNDASPDSTPSGLLSSPADISTPSSAASSTSNSTTHFPLFKPSTPSTLNTGKLRPSPLSLYNNPRQNGNNSLSTFSLKSGSPTSAVSRDSTTATDVSISPRAVSAAVAAAASSGVASPLAPRSTLPLHSGPLVSMSSTASNSGSSYSSNNSSPISMTAPCSSLCQSKSGLASNQQQQHPNCFTKQSTASQQIHHHPACQHHTNLPEDDESMAHGPKLGRVTKNVRRFGLPQFRPQLDESDPGTFDPSRRDRTNNATMKTTSTSTGYGMRRHQEEEDDDLGVYALEPPKKRQRSTATMLLDAAFETVIFTGAVALSAYQLITGKGKTPGHSKQASLASDIDDDGLPAEIAKALEDDPMEEKLALQLDSVMTSNTPKTIRPYSTSGGTLGRTPSTSSRPASFHHKSKAQRASFRASRQSFSTSIASSASAYSHIPHQHSGHFRSPSMPVRPNTGTEDTDEAFLRMEAQLNSLIAEGKRALTSRIEVWDEE
ncbi:hypothetical protein BGW39_006222 [Mortierella sp. 14UC]|nr:hypothetical protein BGW39_006222 [Mortierella sp. 14UC]